ncbi:MAG: hypothetical protein ACUVQY_03605 [Thermoproteota archaeon]
MALYANAFLLVAMFLSLLEHNYLQFAISLIIDLTTTVSILHGGGVLKLNDLHKAILMLAFIPVIIYPSPRSSRYQYF